MNNIVHRTAGSRDPLDYMYGGCKKADDSSPWAIENHRNIYVFDSMDDFTFGRSFDRYIDCCMYVDCDNQNGKISKYLMTSMG